VKGRRPGYTPAPTAPSDPTAPAPVVHRSARGTASPGEPIPHRDYSRSRASLAATSAGPLAEDCPAGIGRAFTANDPMPREL